MELFDKCVKVILNNEGGYVNNPHDPGGETNFGITKRNYPELDIKNLTREQAKAIYHEKYWRPMKLDDLPESVALEVFDFGVNAGPTVSIKLLQGLLKVVADGIIGPLTLKAIQSYPTDLVNDLKHERKKFYFALARKRPELQVFLAGWLNRVDHTKF